MAHLLDAFSLSGPVIIALITAGFILGALLAVWLIRFNRAQKGRRHQNSGHAAEADALRLLKKLGFQLLAAQPVYSSQLQVDGSMRKFEITPDFLVERNQKRYVVEVKQLDRGEASVSKADIRRQILEYLHVSGLPCLLIQMPQGIIEAIALPDARVPE